MTFTSGRAGGTGITDGVPVCRQLGSGRQRPPAVSEFGPRARRPVRRRGGGGGGGA